MLITRREWDLSFSEELSLIISGGWIAKDPLYHVYLDDTDGYSKYGVKQYYVFAPDWAISHSLEYREWRTGFKAFNHREALEIANNSKRVESFCKRIWRQEFNKLIGEG